MSDFYSKLINEINRQSRQKPDNACVNRFRPHVSSRVKLIHYFQVIMNNLQRTFSKLTKSYLSRYEPTLLLLDQNNYFVNSIYCFEKAYEKLGDEASKEKYLSYISFNYIRRYGARLPFDIESFDAYERELSSIVDTDGYQLISVNENEVYLPFDPIGFTINFKLQQYAYQNRVVIENGDVVLDCGAANGDTALYFTAYGASKVYSFEFLKENIIKFNNTMLRNKAFSNLIELVERALWDESNIRLSFSENGNATSVQKCSSNEGDTVQTITIDEFTAQKGTHVDFIKMDIEGAELNALRGAKETILKYKPKLAICVYHKDDDLVSIPDFIDSLNCDYEMYFDYYTDTGAEAVLYARAVDK
ncbi:FkbM family methyltransferase [Pseudoalteromonas piscicida]|uniref:FkbM family methyltransferase n=1 Tax=Pseudoalteromonas piscicida TaxID=43662 RepID=UPI0027E57CBB|nr:FkbM family methyltransferase [Pseudoalteromonas piscicida]WMO14140.1 FkbM family methyltransferase [Pseudoalteromonas piscicida]